MARLALRNIDGDRRESSDLYRVIDRVLEILDTLQRRHPGTRFDPPWAPLGAIKYIPQRPRLPDASVGDSVDDDVAMAQCARSTISRPNKCKLTLEDPRIVISAIGLTSPTSGSRKWNALCGCQLGREYNDPSPCAVCGRPVQLDRHVDLAVIERDRRAWAAASGEARARHFR